MHPESHAPVLIVDRAAAPADESFMKFRRSVCIELKRILQPRGASVQHNRSFYRWGLRMKYSLVVTLVIFQIGKKAATLCIMIAMFFTSSNRLRAP